MTRFEDLEEFNLSKEVVEKLKNPEMLRKELAEGKTFQEIFNYSDDVMGVFYKAAYQLFQRQQYAEAADAFFFLTNLSPYVSTYWLGLGMSEQLSENPSSALIAYSMATVTDPQNPLPHYHSAACYKELHEEGEGLAALELAIETAGEVPEFATIKRHALALKEKWSKKKLYE